MSTSEPKEREQQDGEELVAYLDGELPPEDSRRIEERLAADADYRAQLHELDRAWEALDALPKATADEDFARTTIEMVAVHAQRDLSQQEVKVAHANRWQRLRWVAAGIAVAIVSFALASALLPNRDQQLLVDLPVIRQIDYLKPITDIDFLRELANRVTVAQLSRDEQTLSREVKAIEAASAPWEQREEWVQSLTPEEKHNLWAQQDRFYNQTSEEEQERLRKLQAEIAAAPDREKLETMLVAYYQWYSFQRDSVKQMMRDGEMAASARVNGVLENVEVVRELGDAEEKRLREEIRAIASDMKDAFRKFVVEKPAEREDDEQLRRELLKFIDGEGLPAAVEYLTIYWALINPETAPSTRERLMRTLDDHTIEFLRDVGPQAGGPPRRGGWRGDPLRYWSLDSMPSLRRSYTSNELRQFFRSNLLDDDQRRRIAEAPQMEFEAEVARVLREQELKVRVFERFMGLDRGGRRSGGRGGPGPRGNDPGPPPRGGRGERLGNRGGQDEDRRGRGDDDERRRRDNNDEDSRSRNDRQPV